MRRLQRCLEGKNPTLQREFPCSKPNNNLLFSLGQVVATPGALAALEKAGQLPTGVSLSPRSRRMGDLCEEDQRETHSAWSAVSGSSAVTALMLAKRLTSLPKQTALFTTLLLCPYDINDYAWYRGIPKEGAEGVIGYERES